jgi:Ca2+-binding EF-hand superfamily protein
VFRQVDRDQDGKLGEREFGELVRLLGLQLEKDQVKGLWDRLVDC